MVYQRKGRLELRGGSEGGRGTTRMREDIDKGECLSFFLLESNYK